MAFSALQRIFVSIAFIAIMLRAVVPVGWMLTPDAATGDITIQLCSGRMVYWDPDSGKLPSLDHSELEEVPLHVPSDEDSAIANCPFAMATPLFVAASPLAYNQIVSYSKITHIRPPVRGPPNHKVVSAPLPARGPPLFS
ncbi:hypothetical protein [Hirschia litorea]|uniref:Uncharacterized protein n=1 Tax=Hirschia litorea TaxID=1199156 RepID=A0ABW2IHH9_9PROT